MYAALVGVEQRGAANATIHLVTAYTGSGGSQAYLYEAFNVHRVKGGTVTCGGKSFAGPYTTDMTGHVGDAFFGFPILNGAVRMTITHAVEVSQ